MFFSRREGNGGLRGYKTHNKPDRNRKQYERRDKPDYQRDNNRGYGDSK